MLKLKRVLLGLGVGFWAQAWGQEELLHGAQPQLTKDFCQALLGAQTGPRVSIDASGNPVAPADLPVGGTPVDDLGRAVMPADLPSGSSFHMPESLSFPLRFAVGKRALASQADTSLETTSQTSHTGVMTSTGQSDSEATTTTPGAPATVTALTHETGTNTTTGTTSSSASSASQTQGMSSTLTETFDKSAELRLTVHRDGRVSLEGQDLEGDENARLRADCQKFLAKEAP